MDHFFEPFHNRSTTTTMTVARKNGSACTITPINPMDERCLSHVKSTGQPSNELGGDFSISRFTIWRMTNPVAAKINRIVRIRLVMLNMFNGRAVDR